MYNFDLTQKAIIENNNHNNTTFACGDSGEPVTISTIPPVYLHRTVSHCKVLPSLTSGLPEGAIRRLDV
jgi:hypothetical protein